MGKLLRKIFLLHIDIPKIINIKAQSSDCYLRLFFRGQSTLPWTYTTGAGYAAKDILDSGRQVQCVYITLGLRDGRVRPCYRLIYPRHIGGALAR